MNKIIGEIQLPGDKSISHRAALFTSISGKTCTFSNFNFNRDCSATLNCLQKMGIKWQRSDDIITIHGKKTEQWHSPGGTLDAQNSGTTARLLSGVLAGLSFGVSLDGDSSLRKRPMKRIIDPLTMMGANIESGEGYLPLKFHPVEKLSGIRYRLPVASAQVKSALLLAGLFADGQTEIIEPVQTRDHTERILQLKTVIHGDQTKSVYSNSDTEIPDLSMQIPGDFSSAAFFICAALALSGSELNIRNVSLNPTRTGLLSILQKMQADIEIEEKSASPEPIGNLIVKYSGLRNIEIPQEIIPNIIDEIPILCVLASQAEGPFVLHGAEELRFKESDRISAMVQNLRAVGLTVNEFDDGLTLTGPQKISGGRVAAFDDHRIAMAFAIANLLTDEEILIDNPDCASVSFPQFWRLLRKVVGK